MKTSAIKKCASRSAKGGWGKRKKKSTVKLWSWGVSKSGKVTKRTHSSPLGGTRAGRVKISKRFNKDRALRAENSRRYGLT